MDTEKSKSQKLQEAGKKFSISEIKIESGMVVSFTDDEGKTGWYRVRKCTKNKVNLGSIFGRTLYHKGVDKSRVKEDHDAWYKSWQQSETYQCM